jgi:choline dehydrogenase-like flavoprotein
VFSDNATDWCGLPSMTTSYALTPRDEREIQEGADHLDRVATALGRYAADGQVRTMPLGTHLHYQGTVRMGPANDGTSVCDSFARVWDLPNLFVAGNGVIPTVTVCNPTLMSAAIAARSAGALVRLLAQ